MLEQELKRAAEALRLPVSNLVRTILEDALAAVELVGRRAEGELRSATARLAHSRGRLRDLGGRPTSEPATVGLVADEHAAGGPAAGEPAGLAPIAGERAAGAASVNVLAGESLADGDAAAVAAPAPLVPMTASPGTPGTPGTPSNPGTEAANDAFADVLGWQPLILATRRACARCGRALPVGEQAFVAVSMTGRHANPGGPSGFTPLGGSGHVAAPNPVIGRECLPTSDASDASDADARGE